MKKIISPLLLTAVVFAGGCRKGSSSSNDAKLIFKFTFDSTQSRLNNIGQPSSIPTGHATQSPVFNKMSAHYIELAQNPLTALGAGAILYKAPETTVGGSTAIDFEKASFAGNREVFISLPINSIPAGEYEWLRISLAYQNADVKYFLDTTINGVTIQGDFSGTLAGFIGFNTYIKNFTIKNQSLAINGNRRQGYWGFETTISGNGFNVPFTTSGQAPEGATTVVNPIFNTSPIPAGSCVVTAQFVPGKLKITGRETRDIVIDCSFSTNKSFEWEEIINDGKWQPTKGEKLIDMGIRGMVPTIQ